jgi:hypothetical protein
MNEKNQIPQGINEMKRARAKRCMDDINAILEKHKCILVPMLQILGTKMTSDIACRPLDIDSEQEPQEVISE